MKRLLLVFLLCGCSGPDHVPVVPEGPARRTEGVVFSGGPTPGPLAACSAGGAWQLGGAVVRHWIDQPEDGKRFFPPDGAPKLRLFRDSLPFPYLSWQPSDLQINQLVYPSGPGFVAQYHVMNHGSEPRTCRLSVGITSREGVERDGRTLRAGGRAALVSVDEPAAGGGAALTYELTIEPGTSKFVHLTTPELQGSFAPELLNAAAEAWERKLGDRKFSAPDPALVTAYHADLAGAALGVAGCAEALAAVHERIARKEGEALRLLADAPESWTLGSVHVAAMSTPFGPLTLRYEGAFSAMNYELGGACRPPGGFLVAVPPGFRARADGKDLPVQDGAARAPAGSKAVEISRSE
jgi:hypothetical protein